MPTISEFSLMIVVNRIVLIIPVRNVVFPARLQFDEYRSVWKIIGF